MTTPREVFFEPSEYQSRLIRLQEALVANGIDLLVTCAPGNICYLNGYVSVNVLDIMFVAIPPDGKPVFYLWQFERGRAESTVTGMETVCWDTGVDPIEFLVNDLTHRGYKKGRIGIDTGSTHTSFDTVQRLLSQLNGEPTKGLIEKLRLVKSSAEQQYVREAAAITDAGVKAAVAAIAVGKDDHEIGEAAGSALLTHKSEFLALEPIICVGWRSGAPHSPRGGTRVEPGDPVFIELSGVRARYHSPLMRTVSADSPRDGLQELADYSNACVEKIVDTIKPGITASDVALAASEVLKPIRDKIAFHDLYAYPVGIGFPPNWIENPAFYLSVDNHARIDAGMVFHLPLTLRILGQYGAGFSETLIVTETGAETLSTLPRSLHRQDFLS